MKLTPRQLDTILAALRHWQANHPKNPEYQIAIEHGDPLDDYEIDELCESLNTAESFEIENEGANG